MCSSRVITIFNIKFTDTLSFLYLSCIVTCFSRPNNSYLKYWFSLLIDICKFPDVFFILCTIMINKEQKPNPEEDQIRPLLLGLLIKEPPTMTHKDLQKSTATSMAWTAKLWLVLERCGLMQVVSTLWICGIFNFLRKSYDAITKLLVTKFKLPFEITWSETDFFFLVAILKQNEREYVLGFCIHPTVDSSPLSPSVSKRFQVNCLWHHDINQLPPFSRNKKGCNALPS